MKIKDGVNCKKKHKSVNRFSMKINEKIWGY